MKTLRFAILFVAATLCGCGSVKVTVYGATGKPYVAPDLCAAQLACQQAGEAFCYYAQSYEFDPVTKQLLPTYKCEVVKK